MKLLFVALFFLISIAQALVKLPAFGNKNRGIAQAKQTLFDELASAKPSRKAVEGIIKRLGEVQGDRNRRDVKGRWKIVWTTEDEVNIFVKLGLVKNGKDEALSSITQVIGDGVIINNIPFRNGGYLSVKGTCGPADKVNRNEFAFTEATLSLMWWKRGQPLRLPPVGEGWFDTIYCDDDLRCDFNSRGDILVLAKG
mmetsp:Transcript_18868/g.39262  ORF Transcript_18868/g.39262 Transcript_18868/m.39262 type:complete len:197 (+) Transcript_18868:173-763(+)|eukprot:CAMPEP_0118657392 /NCGR_PEP_ID=MMETSP0785-20121206/13993_1 /TAXON_ID=91992 /ORGANISM="Bolidomonas pacifica, Strain CCMP 1866" /LENGTH=196 /DNA_ID=CAMNT_0006550305 /DNA_START=155 /DNA_END=745 /DNA_ORIENTATION=+